MIYLDHAATTFPKPAPVQEAIARALQEEIGNPGRSSHQWARRADAIVAKGRRLLNELLNGVGPDQVIFTLNGTDALNLAIKGVLRPGDHVVTGRLEHNSVRRPIAGLVGRGVTVTTIEPDAMGTYSPASVREALRPSTRLVALTHASNVLGTVQPIEEIGAVCRSAGVLLLVDAAQTAGCWPIDVRSMQIDLLAAPGHKSLFGPMGVGFLYVAPGVRLTPWREGGTGGGSERELHPSELPEALEAGTPNVPGIAGLSAGIEWIKEQGGASTIAERERIWTDRLFERLASLPSLECWEKADRSRRLPMAVFRVPGLSPHEIAMILDSSFGIGVRAGLHCAPGAHDFLGWSPEGGIRVSGSALSTAAEIDALASALEELVSSPT